ncbi:MAG: nucleotidyl transferase AbiEii/AbiGii toxin family protein [Polyangiaceae bacterium]|nr:nucleotidyl transferase AbiEii/AbiGii toxin family protein [Polyangiaceae bacterium]
MSDVSAPERALASIANELTSRGRQFALVGGLAVSVRAEVRFTRDVDIAVLVSSDADAEMLVRDLPGYRPIAVVEHDALHRLSTVRLESPEGVVVDLLFASTGLEQEIVSRAEPMELPHVGTLRVARGEELLAMKILSMRESRLKDRIDAEQLLAVGGVDLEVVRADLALIRARGFSRGEDLEGKLASVVKAVARRDE